MNEADRSQVVQEGKFLYRHSRHRRNPSFGRAEIKALLNLVDKYKSIIQSKTVTSAVNQLKDRVWDRITKLYNKQGFENVRNCECLKTKWENIKRLSKKSTNNIYDTENDDLNKQVASILAYTEDNPEINKEISESEDEEIGEPEEDVGEYLFEDWGLENDKECANSDGDSDQKRRMRARSFKLEEVRALLNLVEIYKSIILNKSTNNVVNQAKDTAWKKICKEYNKQGFKNVRSVETLKTKWENLKKEAKKVAKNECYEGIDDVVSHTVTLMTQMRDDPFIDNKILESEEEMYDQEKRHKEDDLPTQLESVKEKESDASDDENETSSVFRRMKTSANFSPRECTLLLKMVKREKAHLFLKPTPAGAIRLRNRAWNRLTNAYNKLSPKKRTMKELREKLLNMKKMSQGINFKNYFKHERPRLHKEDTHKVIKSEPLCEYKEVSDMENDNIDDDHTFDNKIDDEHDSFEDDPLSAVLSSDSGVGSTNPPEDQEVNKLKKELLSYKMETAKLERKRVEDQIKSDIAYREAKQIESALRVRAARLEATAAALKLPPGHAALQFTSEEAPAHLYLGGYHFA